MTEPLFVFLGPTGSGKTTQIPQFLLDTPLPIHGMIGITQPRRVAATTLATRVSKEVGTNLGDLVGYNVRFDEISSRKTKIKYLTDGMLLREILGDSLLMKYSVLILDEAHERTLRTDILFGLVKGMLQKRQNMEKKLKVVIMSATLDAEKFSNFFEE